MKRKSIIDKAIKGLCEGIFIKKYDGTIYYFSDYERIYLAYYQGELQFFFRGLSGTIPVNEFGETWGLREDDL